jgi:hypothetical protein
MGHGGPVSSAAADIRQPNTDTGSTGARRAARTPRFAGNATRSRAPGCGPGGFFGDLEGQAVRRLVTHDPRPGANTRRRLHLALRANPAVCRLAGDPPSHRGASRGSGPVSVKAPIIHVMSSCLRRRPNPVFAAIPLDQRFGAIWSPEPKVRGQVNFGATRSAKRCQLCRDSWMPAHSRDMKIMPPKPPEISSS